MNLLMVDDRGLLTTELFQSMLLADGISITDDRPHNVGVVWDGQQVHLYVDGLQVASGDPRSLDVDHSPRFFIGCGKDLSSNSFWDGWIDEVQIYDRMLSQDSLITRYLRDLRVETDIYYTGLASSKHVRIDMNYDKALAAVISEDATNEQIARFANSLGLRVVGEIDRPNRIVRLELPFAISRMEATKFTRAARKLLTGSPFVEIGLAVTPGAAKTSVLVNEQFTVQLADGASIDEIIEGRNVRIVRQNPFNPNEYLLEVTGKSEEDAMVMARELHDMSGARYAVPNLAIVPQFRGYEPNDPLFSKQWHLNDEPNDADIDAPEAWEISKGDGVVIAVIDSIDDSDHPDLSGNLWINPGEYGKEENYDDDGNGYKDDIHGCDFGYSDDSERAHGTAVAGCIGAQMDNNIGIRGCCPNCKLMLLRCNITTFEQHLAFDYARKKGADVICCSWGYNAKIETPVDVSMAIQDAAEKGRPVAGPDPNRGCVIVFAMSNDERDNSGDFPDISSLEHVIAVSGSTDKDQCGGAGFGDCMEVLAPTSIKGTRGIVTTCTQDGNAGYTSCFSGTSAACATTAGVAGLILSVNPKLTRGQVQYVLQNTADKIEPSKANYDPVNGFSRATVDDGTKKATHGYGRVNAYEAVRVAAQGVDVFLRDNKLDWGNTEQPSSTLFEYPRGFIPYWESPDIMVGNNGIEVRVRNRGVCAAKSVDVDLYYCIAGTALPQFSPNNSNQWTHLGNTQTINVPYPGSPEAPKIEDALAIASFPLPDESNHYCLLAMVQCDKDLRSTDAEMSGRVDANIPNDNNISLYNVVMIDSSTSEVQFYVRNPYDHYIRVHVEHDPSHSEVWFDPSDVDVYPEGEKQKLVTMHIDELPEGEMTIRQIRVDGGRYEVMDGGLTCQFKQ